MNTPDFEQPALTAYALGELNPAEAAAVRRMINTSPAIRTEYERIAQTVAAMRIAPPLPRRALSPRQRETIIAMGRAPSRSGRIVPFSQARVRTPSAAWGFLKFAAAACLTVGAFIMGQKLAPQPGESDGVHVAKSAIPAPAPETAPAAQVAASSQPSATAQRGAAVTTSEAASFEAVLPPPSIAPVLLAEAPAPPPANPVVAEPATVAPPAVAPHPAQSKASALNSFTLAATQPDSVISVHPQLMRVAAKPVPREFAGQLLAAPIAERPKAASRNSAPRKPEPQPPLVIHLVKAEIASCPWDSSRRLMRVVAQMPADQDGIEINSRDYQIAVKFDPAQVQAWRLITEKHMPPSNGGLLATRFAWYEIVPGRSFAPKSGKPATIGVLDIVQPRGTPRDSQPLKLLDRGLAWDDAREDFIFETAMVGFNLLLQGTENVGGLNHKLVLELAEQSKDDDPKGVRGKFITVVKQAQRAAGL